MDTGTAAELQWPQAPSWAESEVLVRWGSSKNTGLGASSREDVRGEEFINKIPRQQRLFVREGRNSEKVKIKKKDVRKG